MVNLKPDFTGWATKINLKCSDGRVIKKNAFIDNDGKSVPLVWNHQHNDPSMVLGHALLENREEGVFMYGFLNETESGEAARKLLAHGDIDAISIWANQLRQNGCDVLHGDIKEVSLVLAGANPGAHIMEVLSHSDESDDLVLVTFCEDKDRPVLCDEEISHSDEIETNEAQEAEVISHAEEKEEKKMAENPTPAEQPKGDKSVQEVVDSMTEEQRTIMYALIGAAVEQNNKGSEEDKSMKHTVFDEETNNEKTLSHSEINKVLYDARNHRVDSLRECFQDYTESLAHADGEEDPYGFDHVDYLFPDARPVSNTPDIISRNMDWVDEVMSGTKHLPFSRVKSIHADITADAARAKGYIKGHRKLDEVIALLKRKTEPTTIYKKNKLDRDDVLDIVDFDVVAWLKAEMRIMLNEEIARAALIGDGRLTSEEDHIPETNIRPIWKDDELYTIRKYITVGANGTDDDRVKAAIRTFIKSRKEYKGSGNIVLFATEDFLDDALLLTDVNGRDMYESVEKLATKLRVRKIVTVPVFDNQVREGGSGDNHDYKLMLMGVDLRDYAFGADKGGNVGMFDDFDINYNQMIYLMETRCSGALTKPYSAIVIEEQVAAG